MKGSRGITVLGSTGSIGVSTLDVVARHPERFHVVALTAHSNVERVVEQAIQFQPRYVVMVDAKRAQQVRERLAARALGVNMAKNTEVLSGVDALCEVAALPEVDVVMAAIVGAAGLLPTLSAVRAGKRILLANKESLVMGGEFFMRAVQESGAELLPVDSEHNAIFQCMPAKVQTGLENAGVARILLTGSGGPFRNTPLAQLPAVTPAQACAHPNWSMGRKISVDSATMMNKGLEFIEACLLFNARPDQVEVVVHPQSVIHSMVEYLDGSVLAQMGNPDMRTPIAHALGWPERIRSGVPLLDLIKVAQLHFEAPDEARFPCLRQAKSAALVGGWAPIALNAANEVAVDAFLNEKIRFTDIANLIDGVLQGMTASTIEGIECILAVDQEARRSACQALERLRR
ncbi:1-deoxy-D-xylulose 5-phosphate reductoisomerase [gamma proteobacterium HdN1]|nr:1-deoxy-D-xylulose 5-phosphate reductoisomerase [gamma proteobacterium HdN1]